MKNKQSNSSTKAFLLLITQNKGSNGSIPWMCKI